MGLPRVALRIRPAISKADRVRREHSALAPRRGHDLFRADIASRWPEAIQVYFGHIADSNLHVIVTMPHLDEATKREVEATLYARVASFGGSVSAEHGIGRNKRPYLHLSRTEPELALMGMIKNALDPAGILNPGRVL